MTFVPEEDAGMGRCFELEIVTLDTAPNFRTPADIKIMFEALGSVGLALTNESNGYTTFAVLPLSELL